MIFRQQDTGSGPQTSRSSSSSEELPPLQRAGSPTAAEKDILVRPKIYWYRLNDNRLNLKYVLIWAEEITILLPLLLVNSHYSYKIFY